MALTFPTSPTVGQQYTEGNKTWQWNGTTWDAVNTSDLTSGVLLLPTHATPDVVEASVVWNETTDTVSVGTGLDSKDLAKVEDVPTVLTDLGITDGTAGQVLTTDGAGAFTFETASAATTLDGLTDVTAAGATNGQLLTADGAGNFTFTTVSGVSSTLAGLTDVDVTGQTSGQFLTTDGAGNFTFATPVDLVGATTLDELTDVTAAGSTAGQVLTSDGAGNFTFATPTTTLDGLTDVTAAGSTAGQILSSDGAGAYTFIDHYSDTDVAAYLNTNLDSDIVPDTSITYDVGKAVSRFKELHVRDIFTENIEANEVKAFGQLRLESTSDIILATTTIYGTGANTLDIGASLFPMKEIHTNNLASYTTLTIPINNTPNTADGSMTWDGTNNKLYVGDGTTAIEIGAGGYGDTDVATYLNGNLDTHIIPDTNATYDIGAAEFKIRHLYLSDNSLKFVNASNTEYSMGVDGDGELTFQSVKLSDAAVIKVQSADLDMGGNKVLFANVYTNFGDLPNASLYHGMFAHVHSDAAAYYAHAGAWVKLANDSAVPTALTDLGITDGTSGQVLQTDGSGNFTFATPSGAGAARNTYSGATASIADQASANLDVTGCKSYVIYKITTDVGAWVTIYADAASRTADTRTYADKGSDPTTNGVIAEVITTGAETVLVAPGVYGFNNEATPTTNIPMRVFNDSGGTSAVTVTVDVLTLEA